jgi:alpha-galactosidase
MSPATKTILTNRDVIAIDQDPLGKQGYEIAYHNDLEVFVKPLQGGDTAVCLFNRSDEPKKLDFSWSEYKIAPGHSIRDIWKNQQQGTTSTPYRSEIGKHSVILLRLSK